MSVAVFVRVLGVFLCLPLAGLFPRLVAGVLVGAALAAAAPLGGPLPHLPALAAEGLLGAALGVLAGIPVHAARGLRGADGPLSLGLAGRVWAWTIFFATGGPGLLLDALTASFRVLPAGAWPDTDTLARQGHLLFYGPLVLGLPLFLAALLVEPAAAVVDRAFGAPVLSAGAVSLRGVLGPAALLITAPFLMDELRGLFGAVLA